MVISLLIFILGIQSLLIGFGIIKISWKNEDLKRKHEKRMKIFGIIFIIASIIRLILSNYMENQ